jgi:imidazolonepropionase-like amidohydrolase
MVISQVSLKERSVMPHVLTYLRKMKKSKRHLLVLGFIIFWLALLGRMPVLAGEAEPVLAIKGARIVTVTGEDIPEGVILIKGKYIVDVGPVVTIPPEAKVIEAKGLIAYPGLIDGSTYLGLMEISMVRATVDTRETGNINPQARAYEALRPDSVHIPITRANGTTCALVVPAGGLISGVSGLIKLDGWTPDELVVKAPVAMHIQFPMMRGRYRRQTSQSVSASKRIKELKKLFNEARYYEKRRLAAQKNLLLPYPDFDEKLEALLPVVHGQLPVMISVYAEKDIKDVIKFVQEEKLKAILFGVHDGWKMAEEIAKAGLPVVLDSLYNQPARWDDGYDALYRNPAALVKAGVKIAFSSQSASLAKDLPWHAAKAVAFGLDQKEALKAVTINPAEIFGVADRMGSLEKGKLANIVLTDGDILEIKRHVKHLFIEGKEIDLANYYTDLLHKYEKRLKEK